MALKMTDSETNGTSVVTLDGRIVLNTGGWDTRTTRSRMNACLSGWSVFIVRGDSVVRAWGDDDKPGFKFVRAITLHPDGTASGDRVQARRPYRPRAPHREGCECASCLSTYRGPALTVGDQGERTVTPEETAAQYGTDDGERWSDYNRKFNELLRGGK